MKRAYFIFFLLLAILVAGCSKVEYTQTPPSVGDSDWLYDASLPVPILFGSDNKLTRSTISAVDDLTGQKIGVYAVDKDADVWSHNDESIYINNADAFYDSSEQTIAFGTSPENLQTYYYPALSAVSLDFYAYCADGAYDFKVQDNEVTVVVPFGQNDIIWAYASAEEKVKNYTIYNGYNAEYIRNFPEEKPEFAFSHPATALRFRAMNADPLSGTNIRIENVYLSGVALNGTLVIAERGEPKEYQGQLRFVDGVNSRGILQLKPEDMGILLTEEKVMLGHMFILPEPELDQIVGKAKITIDGQSKEADLKINPQQLGAVVNGFVSGYSYNLMLCVYDDGTVEVLPDI